MLHDIHSHTYYSGCGRDDPHLTCDAAVKAGLALFGISDHNYGVESYNPNGERFESRTDEQRAEAISAYLEFLKTIRDEYKGKIQIALGIELYTRPAHLIGASTDVSRFDYALLENLGSTDSALESGSSYGGIIGYAERLGCRAGIAHTDLFGYCESRGYVPLEFMSSLAHHGIFWEMNVNFDSIHRYEEHEYVKTFVASEEQQDIVMRSGITISVGFDGHRVEDYLPERVIQMCNFLDERGFKTFQI